MSQTPRSRLKLAAFIALPLLGLGACASTPPQPVTPPPPVVVSTAIEAVGVVQSVNMRTRQVVVRTPENRNVTLVVPESVQNLDRVRRGNCVRVRFEEAVAVQMTPRGTDLPAEVDVGAARAPAGGDRPAGAAVVTVRDTVTINSVDQATNAVTFTLARRAPHGGGAFAGDAGLHPHGPPGPARERGLHRSDRHLGRAGRGLKWTGRDRGRSAAVPVFTG